MKAHVVSLCTTFVLMILVIPSHAQEPSHEFFDRQNVMLWSGVAVAHAMDCDSTWKMLDSGAGREVELPPSLAQSRVQMTLFSIGVVGAQVGGSYMLHRLGWHKAERWASAVHMGATATTAVHNYGLRPLAPVSSALR